jgi:hypothetical protein
LAGGASIGDRAVAAGERVRGGDLLMAIKRITTDIIYPGDVFVGGYLSNISSYFRLQRAKRREPPFYNWYKVSTSKYQVWISEPIYQKDLGWCIRFQREINCHSDGIEVFESLILMTLEYIDRSYVLKNE